MKKQITGYLIMNADDYGPSDYINEGIIKGIQTGIISSISVFVTYQNNRFVKNFESKLKHLVLEVQNAEKKYNRSIGIGLHLSLNAGKPLSNIKDIPELVSNKKKSNGYFKHFYDINITDEYCKQSYIEINNQINYLKNFLSDYEKEIDHINHHVGFVTFHSKLWSTFIDAAKKANLPVRSPLGYMHRANLYYTTGKWSGVYKEGVFQGIGKIFRGKIQNEISDSMFQLIINRAGVMQKRYEYALSKGIKMPIIFNDNFYNQATPLKANNFFHSFKDNEIKEFMLHLSIDKPNVKINVPQGFNKRSFKRRYLELKTLLNENEGLREQIVNQKFETADTIYKLKLINYQNIPNL